MILQPRSRSVSRRSAFTLLEVLVVVAIILVLASVATVSVLQVLKENKTDVNKAQGLIRKFARRVRQQASEVATTPGGHRWNAHRHPLRSFRRVR